MLDTARSHRIEIALRAQLSVTFVQREMPPTRAAGKRPAQLTPATDEGEAKRLRSVIDETAEEFVCALTYELPLDPGGWQGL